MNTRLSAPALRGGLLALLAAGLFGLSTPLVQRFGQGLGAFTTAALLYAGAALVALVMRHPPGREAALRRSDLPRLLAMAGFGAVVGPVALAWGLQRTSGSSASLMLTLEALFTAVLAWKLYGETMDKRVAAAMLLLLAGGMALVLEQGLAGNTQLLGLLAVLAAQRLPGFLSVVPTAKEQGIDVEWPIVRGFYGPPQMPDAAYNYWVETLRRLHAHPAWPEARAGQGLFEFNMVGEEFSQLAKRRTAEYRQLAREVGLVTATQ